MAGLKKLDKLLRKMRAMPQAVQTAVRDEMEQVATMIVSTMKTLVPRDQGALAASMGWTWGPAPEGSITIGSAGGPNGVSITIYAGSAATLVSNSRGVQFQNARLQEFGTKAMAAHPYFFPAVRAHRRGFTARVNRAAVREMRKVWDR